MLVTRLISKLHESTNQGLVRSHVLMSEPINDRRPVVLGCTILDLSGILFYVSAKICPCQKID